MVRRASPTPALDAKIAEAPDLVERIFEYLLTELPDLRDRLVGLEQDVRDEFAGQEVYIPRQPMSERQERVHQVLSLFNGRNASEVGRRLGISRSSVYRLLKQAGTKKPSHVSGK